MALAEGEFALLITVLKARVVAPRANMNLIRWHLTPLDNARIEYLGNFLKTMAAGYQPALDGAEELLAIARGDRAALEPMDPVKRVVIRDLIDQMEAIGAEKMTVLQ